MQPQRCTGFFMSQITGDGGCWQLGDVIGL